MYLSTTSVLLIAVTFFPPSQIQKFLFTFVKTMHGFWSKKRPNDNNAPSLSDDSRDESLSSPTSSIAKFAEKNTITTTVVISSSSNRYLS
jgi:hypothetical protein